MNRMTVDDIRGLVGRISALMDEKKDELVHLDGLVGDGDLGLTMSKGFRAVAEEAAASTETDAGKLLMKLGMTMARVAPSTMGTLVATGFMSGGKAVMGNDALDPRGLSAFLSEFVAGIMQRGKSKPGEKTLVDVLHPAAEALREATDGAADLGEAMERCYEAAKQGYESSKDLIAQHGRAAYYQEQSRGKADPGGAAALVIIQGMYEYIHGHGQET